MKPTKLAVIAFTGLLFAIVSRAQGAEIATPDDTARFLAGMPPTAKSPLVPFSQDAAWKQHADRFDTTFGNFETMQLAKIREWSSANLTTYRPMMYYLFSGPDFLYANAFFPNASTYVLAGLEPVGQVPDLSRLPRGTVAGVLRNIQVSLSSVLSVSYFITANMKQDLNSGPVFGTLPILYVFLARSGKTIRDVSFVNIDDHAQLQPADAPSVKPTARGVKIVFTSGDGQLKTLYYFSVSLFDEPKGIVFLQYLRQQPRGDSFIKSASYLMHLSSFSQTRNFILENSELVLEDDSGIPVSYFDSGKWAVQPFGRYVGPINIFQEHFQPRLAELYQRKPPKPINFGIGYMSRFSDSNLLLALRNQGARDLAVPVVIDATPPVPIDAVVVLRKPTTIVRSSGAKMPDEKGIY